MSTLEFAWYAAMLILGTIVGWFVRQYFPAYYSEKGKNLATKEDIGAITDTVEKVRSEHQSAIEHLRADLSVAATQRTALAAQSSEAGLKLFDATVRLLSLLRIDLGDIPPEGGAELVRYQQQVSRCFDRIFLQYHRLVLYRGDDALSQKSMQLAEAAIELRKTFSRAFGPVKFALVQETLVYQGKRTPDYEAAVATTDREMQKYRAKLDPLRKELWRTYQEYLAELRNDFVERSNQGKP